MIGLTVRALLYAPDCLRLFAARADGKRALDLESGLLTGDGAGRRTVGEDEGGREDEDEAEVGAIDWWVEFEAESCDKDASFWLRRERICLSCFASD